MAAAPRGPEPRWLEHCLALPGAWRDEPWPDAVVAKVGPKIFAFLGALEHRAPGTDGPGTIGLKCGDREAADLWLDRYPGSVRPMAYLGRYGWNTFVLDGRIADDDVEELVEDSYERVVAGLPRRLRPPRRG